MTKGDNLDEGEMKKGKEQCLKLAGLEDTSEMNLLMPQVKMSLLWTSLPWTAATVSALVYQHPV